MANGAVVEPTILSLESRKSIEIGLADLVTDGRIEVFPHVEEKGLLFLSFKKSRVTLSAGPFIGLIPLTPRISVDVRPKLPVSNLARVLDLSRSSLGSLANVDRLYLSDHLGSNSILEFMAANLVDALRPVEVHGLMKEYVRRAEVTSHPRGGVDLGETMRAAASRGHPYNVASSYYEQTSDVPVNRVLKGAMRHILTRMRPTSEIGRALLRRANRAYRELPHSVRGMRADDLDISRRIVAGRRLPASRTYYYRPLEIAFLILSNRGVALQDHGSDVLLQTFILNFENLFEEYLRRVLQTRANGNLVVKDGNKEGKRSLFDNNKDRSAEPDIVVISRDTNKRVIAEVKYKEKPNRDDINQAITYAHVYRTGRAILVHQNKPGSRAGLKHVGTMNGIALEAYAFDLANPDLDAEERMFASTIFGMVE